MGEALNTRSTPRKKITEHRIIERTYKRGHGVFLLNIIVFLVVLVIFILFFSIHIAVQRSEL